MTCPHCRASRHHLQALLETLETGALQTIRCTLCGWRTSRSTAISAASQPTTIQHRTCTVHGCRRQYLVAPDDRQMCSPHRTRLKAWEASRRTQPAPIQQINGIWHVVRPQQIRTARKQTSRPAGASR